MKPGIYYNEDLTMFEILRGGKRALFFSSRAKDKISYYEISIKDKWVAFLISQSKYLGPV